MFFYDSLLELLYSSCTPLIDLYRRAVTFSAGTSQIPASDVHRQWTLDSRDRGREPRISPNLPQLNVPGYIWAEQCETLN